MAAVIVVEAVVLFPMVVAVIVVAGEGTDKFKRLSILQLKYRKKCHFFLFNSKKIVYTSNLRFIVKCDLLVRYF